MPADVGISAIVLAAGASRRFGEENKLLALVDGRPLVVRVVNALSIGGVADIVVVTGHDRSGVESALRGRPGRFVPNESWQRGMGSSIAVGAAALDGGVAGAFVVPGDMPLLSPQLVAALISAFEANKCEKIVYPATQAGEQRNPVLWPRRHFGALLTLSPGKGAKALLQLVAAECVAVVGDDTVLSDVDTPADLEAARKIPRA